MFELIDNLEVFLNVECGSVLSKKNLKFYRVHRNHHHGDYTCIISDNLKKTDMSSELFDNLILEKRPLWKNFLKFSLTEGRASIFLDRTLCFATGIKNIYELGENYGSNKLNEEIFSISLDKSFDLNNITYLRAKTASDILQQLIKSNGGIVFEIQDSTSSKAKSINRIKITAKCTARNRDEDNSIIIKVGSVLNGNGSNKKNMTIQEYYKIRTEEIGGMCDHKLEINSIANNKEDLVQATIFFDLIQSNIHKTMTLHLDSHKPDMKTSCKGALFVMYNYVRLVALIAKFENLVLSKKYQPLPIIDEVDFSLLSQDAEWNLMYDYALHWPVVVKQSLEHLEEGQPKLHNIFRFLMHFSSEFSIYYHRTRILTDSRPHLMSVLYARIHFLKAIAQVFKNALNLLQLRPLNKM